MVRVREVSRSSQIVPIRPTLPYEIAADSAPEKAAACFRAVRYDRPNAAITRSV
jgi:hypothetical protein